MKNRSSRYRYDAPFRAGMFHGRKLNEAIILTVPVPELEKTEGAPEHIQRWEDDGGPAFEAPDPLPQPAESNTPRRTDALAGSQM